MRHVPPAPRCRSGFLSAALAFSFLLAASAAIAQPYDDPPVGDPPGSSPCPGNAVKVTISGMSFSPAALTVTPGTKVCWQNDEGFHTVTSNTGVFGSGPPEDALWSYSYTFQNAGSFPYHCQVHGSASSGMRGEVVVQAPVGTDLPGALKFTQSNYSIAESGGSATVTVSRTGGDDGAVSVGWTAAAGSATAGTDFTAASGTLSWADNDDDNKTFAVTIVNDTVDEGNETILLTLAGPTGGATLGSPAAGTVTIQDNDDPPAGGSPPTAPTNLQATGNLSSITEVLLSWSDTSTIEVGFHIERRTIDGTFAEIATVPANTVTFASSGDSGQFYLYRVRAAGTGGTFSAYSNEAGAASHVAPVPCTPGLLQACVNNGNFELSVAWRTATANGDGTAVPLPSAPASALFYFFNPTNIEQLVKVLNGCAVNNRYWVFFAATTNVEFVLTVTDTRNGRVKTYFNPLNRAAPPVQDTDAFATCP